MSEVDVIGVRHQAHQGVAAVLDLPKDGTLFRRTITCTFDGIRRRYTSVTSVHAHP